MADNDQDLYQRDPSSRLSPQGDTLDYILWDRLSKFWSTAYRAEDRQALNAIYEASAKVLDAEMVRLAEVNAAKGLYTAPVYTQRRWVRLDLNRYNEMKNFLAFAISGRKPNTTPGYVTCDAAIGDTQDQYLACASDSSGHAAHWHIHFSWVLPNSTTTDRRTLRMGYPLRQPLIEIWRMRRDSSARLSGEKLVCGIDFSIQGDGTSILLAEGEAGDIYDVSAAIDISDRVAYDGRLPLTKLAVGPHPGLRSLAIPPELQGFPVHVMLVRSPPPVVGGTLQETGATNFATETIFIPFTGDPATGVATPTPGLAAYPSSYPALSSIDVAYVFGVERVADGTAFNRLHVHEEFSFFLTRTSANVPAGSTHLVVGAETSVIALPNGVVPPGYEGSLDYLGQEVRFFLDGRKLHRSEYVYSPGPNTLTLRLPLTLTETQAARVDVQYTREFEGLASQSLDLHYHAACMKQNAAPITLPDEFDDGGDFDEDSEEVFSPPWGTFDTSTLLNIVYLASTDIDLTTLRLYANGRLLAQGYEYTVSIEEASDTSPGRTRIVFAASTSGLTVEATYRLLGAVINYGMTDIFGGTACSWYLNSTNLEQILGDVGALLNNFVDAYGPARSPDQLIEAARVLAVNGNPMLTLFADEFNDYRKYQINAEGMPYTAAEARDLESSNTRLVSIPVLVDHPHRPTVRLIQNTDYVVRDGGISTSIDMLRSRGADDSEPGVWWCPVILLDESTLAKTFGDLVGDVRTESSFAYRDALIANHTARWQGPSAVAIEAAAACFLGSPTFQQDGTVTRIDHAPTAVTVTVQGAAATQVYALPPTAIAQVPGVGETVFAGQSLASPTSIQSTLAALSDWSASTLSLVGVYRDARVGDLLWIELFDAVGNASWVRVGVRGVRMVTDPSVPGQVITVITFDREVISRTHEPNIQSRYRLTRPFGPPFVRFDGTVTSVEITRQWKLTTSAGESFLMPVGTPLTYHVGSVVRRSDAVIPGFATLYDDAIRKDWQWLKPEDVDDRLSSYDIGSVASQIEDDQRYVTIDAASGGLSRISMSRIQPIPPRGTALTVRLDGTNAVETYTVTGSDGVTLFATPAVTERRSGLATFKLPTKGVRATYFELPPAASLTGRLAAPHPVRATSLQLISTIGFPPAGRIGLFLDGGCVEVAYYRIAGNFLTDLTWLDPDEHDALRDNTGRLIPVVPACQVVLLSVYDNKILNPAMEALITRRIHGDSGSYGSLRLTNAAVDEYYRLFKNNASVLELNRVGTPKVLHDLLEDTVPPSTTMVVLSRHEITDVYEAGATDG